MKIEDIIEKRWLTRFLFLRCLYEVSGANFRDYIDYEPIIASVLGQQVGTTRQDVENAIEYLEGKQLIKTSSPHTVRFEHVGIDEVEAKLAHPERPTNGFPVVVNLAMIGQINNSQFQQGTTDSCQYGKQGESRPQGADGEARLSPLERLCESGLEKSDALVLTLAGEHILAAKHNQDLISAPAIVDRLQADGLTHDDAADSIEHLETTGFISTNSGRHSRFFQLTTRGFDAYLRCCYSDYARDYQRVCRAIVDDVLNDDVALVQHLELARPLVLHILAVLSANGLCGVRFTNVGSTVTNVSVELRRRCRKS